MYYLTTRYSYWFKVLLAAGIKWNQFEALQQAKSALRHGDIVGQVQHGRGGFELGTSRPTWHRTTHAYKKGLLVKDIQQQEEAERCAKTESQAKKVQWARLENFENLWEWKTVDLASSSEPSMMFPKI